MRRKMHLILRSIRRGVLPTSPAAISSPLPLPFPPNRVPKQTTASRLEGVLELLQSYNWSFKEFLHHWTGYKAIRPVRIGGHHYNTTKKRRAVLQDTLKDLVADGICDMPVLTKSAICSLGVQLDALIDKSVYFSSLNLESITPQYLEQFDFTEGIKDMMVLAPTWHHFLETILEPRRGYTDKSIQRARERSFYVTVMACNARAYNTSSHLLMAMDMYLHSLGVKRRVIETLATFGICHADRHGNTTMGKIADQCRVCTTFQPRSCAFPIHKLM
jgi:hypothetical protein